MTSIPDRFAKPTFSRVIDSAFPVASQWAEEDQRVNLVERQRIDLDTVKSQLLVHPKGVPSSPNYSYTPPPFCSLLAGEAREKGRCDNGTNVVALGCTINRHPTVRNLDFRYESGVVSRGLRTIPLYDKSAPHGTEQETQCLRYSNYANIASRFLRPDNNQEHAPVQEFSVNGNPATFSNPRTHESRVTIKPFGMAVDKERNDKCTTYGDDVFIEYNPMAFFGPDGSKMITKYFNNVIAGLAMETPVFPDQIILKDYSAGLSQHHHSNLAEQITRTSNNIDWWADDVNKYIEDVECLELQDYLAKYNSARSGYQPGALEQLIPEVLDKLTIANNLIKDYKQYAKPDSLDNKPRPAFRAPGLYANANANATAQIGTLFQSTRGYNNTTNTNTNTNTNTDENARFRIPTRSYHNQEDTTTDQTQRVYYDDNCTVKISNFGDAHMLDIYDIKDFLREYGLDSSKIKFKVTLPKNKETGQARDFIYLNFCDDAGLSQALEILQKQRLVYEYGILSVESVEPRTRR